MVASREREVRTMWSREVTVVRGGVDMVVRYLYCEKGARGLNVSAVRDRMFRGERMGNDQLRLN
jgi:hypothetical protein